MTHNNQIGTTKEDYLDNIFLDENHPNVVIEPIEQTVCSFNFPYICLSCDYLGSHTYQLVLKHIKTSQSVDNNATYTYTIKACDKKTLEQLKRIYYLLKNKIEDDIAIVVQYEEYVAPQVANTLFQRISSLWIY